MKDSFSSPKDNLLQLGLREGAKVADFGTGSGHYARAAAGIVGINGRVYAVDIQEDVLKHLKLNTHEHHQGTIETVWGNIEKLGGSHLRDASVDALVLANILFQIHINERQSLVSEVVRVLKPGGKLLVVDWTGSYGGMGPTQESVVSESEVTELFIGAGFEKTKTFAAGTHHYGIVFTHP